MEAENYYVKNLETGKLNVFSTKSYYDSLPHEQQKLIKNNCLWSRKQECWISKGKADNSVYLRARLKDLGFINKGTSGEAIPFAEQVQRLQAKAEYRADRSQTHAENAKNKSDALLESARAMASVIPMGQPILVGHHSEKRDRNYRDKIHNKFGKAFAEKDKADYYSHKAEIAKETAAGKKYEDPSYLSKRIKESEKCIRLLERRLEGRFYAHSPVEEISEASRQFYTRRLGEEKEKLSYYQQCLENLPVQIPENDIAPKKQVRKSRGI